MQKINDIIYNKGIYLLHIIYLSVQHLSLMTKFALSRKGCIVWVNLNVYVFYKILYATIHAKQLNKYDKSWVHTTITNKTTNSRKLVARHSILKVAQTAVAEK